ncbi:MAG: flagellar basal body L-ring protein FlgH [Gammaproteobacteria bacterium]|nr:flagellar basal body L-ring protein FlgH [Gammaproteobacteria bacterium]
MKQGFVFLPVLLCMACAHNPPPPADIEFAPIRPVVASPPPQENGSIYQTGYGMSLFSDMSAKRVGDSITVILQENTNAKKSSSTSTSKDSSVDIAAPTVFGNPLSILGRPLSAGLESGNSFAGAGDASQSNSLNGRVTVTVSEVLPNGYLIVQGEKRLQLNQGGEHVKFSGIVRPADIKADNTVLSTNVANAQIIYGSSGVIADANTQGWLARLFNSPMWPF